jgi:hypothetical protein
MQESRPTLYASRRIDRPVGSVVADIEKVLTRRNWRVVVEPRGTGSVAPTRTFAGFLYRDSGTSIARVEVEVTAWSHGSTEVGVRPVGSRARRAAARRPYGDAVVLLLDQLTRRAVHPAAPPDRTWPQALPQLRRAS